jgi:hypothetical protein
LILVVLSGGYGSGSGDNLMAGGGRLAGLILVILLVLLLVGHLQKSDDCQQPEHQPGWA